MSDESESGAVVVFRLSDDVIRRIEHKEIGYPGIDLYTKVAFIVRCKLSLFGFNFDEPVPKRVNGFIHDGLVNVHFSREVVIAIGLVATIRECAPSQFIEDTVNEKASKC